VFVGSSSESLDVAYAVQENLEFTAEVTVWTQGVFEVSRLTLDALMRAIDTFDFAIFIFTPDDVLRIRDQTYQAVRDNVVFELGLFTGGLGEDRTFIVAPRGTEELHLPSDLAGLTPATYEPNRSDRNMVAALGPACTRIRRMILEAGLRTGANKGLSALAPPVAAGLSEELRSEVGSMLRDQHEMIERAFAQFESRVTAMLQDQHETAKAPVSRLIKTIRSELSEEARRLLHVLARGGHLTIQQYVTLQRSNHQAIIAELRNHTLLVPLATPPANDGSRERVYWFPPATAHIIAGVARDLDIADDARTQSLIHYLEELGYNLPVGG